MRWFLVVIGCAAALAGCCTEAGCSGAVGIELDRMLTADAVVTVEMDGVVTTCSTPESPPGDGSCAVRPTEEGGAELQLLLGYADPPASVVVSVSEGGAPATAYPVGVSESKPFYPNGRQCGGACAGGSGALTLPPAPATEQSCEDEQIFECPLDECAKPTGLRLDVAGQCIGERRAFCLDGAGGEDLETTATDPDGARWLFPTMAIPAMWTPVAADPAEAGAGGWADCATVP